MEDPTRTVLVSFSKLCTAGGPASLGASFPSCRKGVWLSSVVLKLGFMEPSVLYIKPRPGEGREEKGVLASSTAMSLQTGNL